MDRAVGALVLAAVLGFATVDIFVVTALTTGRRWPGHVATVVFAAAGVALFAYAWTHLGIGAHGG